MGSRIAHDRDDAAGSVGGPRRRGRARRRAVGRAGLRAGVLAILCLYLAGATAPCPAPVGSGAAAPSAAVADDAHPAHHGHGARAGGGHAAGEPKAAGEHSGHETEPPTVSGFCSCGCGKRPTTLAAPLGFVLPVAAGELEPRPGDPLDPAVRVERLPVPPVGAIDHVPLPA